MPKRIQLSRRKGYRKPEGAIVVARPSRWGNPLPWADMTEHQSPQAAREVAVIFYRRWLAGELDHRHLDAQRQVILDDLHELRGHDLACWCPLEDDNGARVPCHADVLLQLANPEVVFPWAR